MLTVFGKEVRKLRLDRGMIMKSMADMLGVSSAYLSSIEHGDKPIPKNFISRLAEALELTPEEIERLESAAKDSSTEVSINVSGLPVSKQRVANSFARALDRLTEKDIEEIKGILERK